MGMNMILSIIMGIAMTAIIGSQVAPSMMEKVKATKVEAKAINNQEVIFEAVKRYITMKQTNPTNLEDVISKGYLNPSINNNGFGGGYSIEIDGSKGLLKVKTTIEDKKAQEIFLNSFKNKFIPTRVETTNEFETTFVIPTDIMHGRGLFMTGIPVQSTQPADTSLKYWYDTSGKEVALRMYDPTSNTWKKVAGTSGGGSISEDALVDASGNNFTKDILPTTDAEVGEIKYAYDSSTNSIQEYVYIGTTQGWVIKNGSDIKIITEINQIKNWSDGTYAKSCLEYRNSGSIKYRYEGAIGNGVYKIDLDGNGSEQPFEVYCDMTSDGGGWTYVTYIYEIVDNNPTSVNAHTNINYYLNIELIKKLFKISSSILFREDSANLLAKTKDSTFVKVKENVLNNRPWFYQTHEKESVEPWFLSIDGKNVPYAQEATNCSHYESSKNDPGVVLMSCNITSGSHFYLYTSQSMRPIYYGNSHLKKVINFIGLR